MLDSIIFWAFAALAVVGGIVAVFNRSIVNAALSLIVVFMAIAGFYLLNNADFLAIAQVIIYVVGLTIMMLFAIMFTGEKAPHNTQKLKSATRIAYGIVLFYVLALVLRAVVKGFAPIAPVTPSALRIGQLAHEGSTTLLGQLLFTDYALPFEVASILLLAAMIGAIVIAKKRFDDSDTPETGEIFMSVDMSSTPPEATIAALREQRLVLTGMASSKSDAATNSPQDQVDA